MAQGRITVWSAHLVAARAFLASATQWRVAAGMGGMVMIGLDYAGVRAGLDAEGLTLSPDDWRALRLIEAGAIEATNGGGA